MQQLCNVTASGLPGIGKTLATAQILLEPDDSGMISEEEETERLNDHCLHVVTLQSEALLCTPNDMLCGGQQTPAEALLEGYSHSIAEISNGSLELVRFFADQRLAGGPHYHKLAMPEDAYLPWILTCPGSTFVVRARQGHEKEAKACLLSWRRRGLQVPKRVDKEYPKREGAQDYEVCPFSQENGYGEVAIDLDVHQRLFPRDAVLLDRSGADT